MPRLLIRVGKLPYERVDPYTTLLRNVTGTNVGNMLFQQAVVKALSLPQNEIASNGYGLELSNVERINESCDVLVLPLANQFRPNFAHRLAVMAKTIRRLYPVELADPIRRIIEQMGHQATVQLRVAIEAFAESDCARAMALEDMDDVMDDLQRELFRTIFALGRADEAGLQQMVQIALVGRYYERMADHAVNIGERVTYMVTGEMPGAEGDGAASGAELGITLD